MAGVEHWAGEGALLQLGQLVRAAADLLGALGHGVVVALLLPQREHRDHAVLAQLATLGLLQGLLRRVEQLGVLVHAQRHHDCGRVPLVCKHRVSGKGEEEMRAWAHREQSAC